MVGSGPRAVSQVEAMRRSGVAEPVAFWNRSAPAREEMTRACGLEESFDDVGKMIEKTRPDVVNIVTHPSARHEVLRTAIDSGAQVILLEKPIALTVKELDLVKQAGREVFIAVNTQYRWMSHWSRFWDMIARGDLGEIRTIRGSTGVDILEQGPHLLSLALSAARSAGLPSPTWALAGCADEAYYDDLVVPADTTAVLDLGAARLQLLAGPSAPRVPGEDVIFYQQQVEVTGSAGRLWVSLNQGWQLWRDGKFESGTTAWPRDDYQSQADLFRDLAVAVRDPSARSSFPTRMETAAEEAELLFACIESGSSGGRVVLGERERAGANE